MVIRRPLVAILLERFSELVAELAKSLEVPDFVQSLANSATANLDCDTGSSCLCCSASREAERHRHHG